MSIYTRAQASPLSLHFFPLRYLYPPLYQNLHCGDIFAWESICCIRDQQARLPDRTVFTKSIVSFPYYAFDDLRSLLFFVSFI